MWHTSQCCCVGGMPKVTPGITVHTTKVKHFRRTLEEELAVLTERLLSEFENQVCDREDVDTFGAIGSFELLSYDEVAKEIDMDEVCYERFSIDSLEPLSHDEVPIEIYSDEQRQSVPISCIGTAAKCDVNTLNVDAAMEYQIQGESELPTPISARLDSLSDCEKSHSSQSNAETSHSCKSEPRVTIVSSAEHVVDRRTMAPQHVRQWLTNRKRKALKNETVLLLCDVLSFLVICCNMAVIGWQLEYQFSEGRRPDSESPVDLAFCTVFFIELLFRFYLEWNNGFFTGPNWAWNWFDFIVVTALTVETLVVEFGSLRSSNVSVLRASRLLRMARLVRAIKLFRFLTFFRSGRVFLLTIIKAAWLLFWVATICFMMSYIFALVIGGRTVQDCHANANAHDNVLLCKYFGSVWTSCASIYQAMLGGIEWGILYDAVQSLETIYIAGFIVYMTFLYCVVFQIVIGVFVVQVMKQTDLDSMDVAIEQREKEEKDFLNELVSYFERLDINDNGTLCKAELNELFSNKDMVRVLAHHNLDTGSVEILFDLLDHNSTGNVDMSDFVEGCVRLRGQARAMDVERIRKDIKHLQTTLNRMANLQPLSTTQEQKPMKKQVDYASSGILSSEGGSSLAVSALKAKSRSNQLSTISTMCKTPSISISNMWHRQRTLIPKTEMRAMAVTELLDILSIIESDCIHDAWIDAYSGEALTVANVNLYQFTYYVISPRTAAPSITLKGLVHDKYPEGSIIRQRHSSSGNIIAEAVVVNETQGPDVEIKLLRGQFFPQHKVALQGLENDEDKPCGAPESVLSNGTSISYKESVSPVQARPDWFVSHWWGESILDFVTCCQEHSQKRQKDKYWICAYANRQHELSNEINEDPAETSFGKAMRLAEGVLLILDTEATPFHRIWCDFELYNTIHEGKMLDIVTAKKSKAHLLTEMPLPNEPAMTKTRREQGFPVHLLVDGFEVQLENGSASMEADKIHILNFMGKSSKTGQVDEELLKENLDKANNSLRGYFALAAWPQALKRGLVRKFPSNDGQQRLSLSDILHSDKQRTYVQLSLSGLDEMNDEEMKSLAEGLPPNIAHLNLSFEDCNILTDDGVSHLSDRIASLPLQRLELYFTSCNRLTDASLSSLSQHLPATVVELTLNFAFCPRITKVGVKHLSDHLPKSLHTLRATFWGSGTQYQAVVFASVHELRRMHL